MAKLIAFLVFMCFQFSGQEEVVLDKKAKDILLAELAFPEEQIIQETYPLDIKLDDENDFTKSTEGAKPFWETAADTEDQLLEDLFEVTFEIEYFMEKANPSMKNFKWFWVLEEASVAKGILPNCSVEWGIFDRESSEESWLDSGNGNTKLMEEYEKLVSLIEKWMVKAIPKYGHYKWLRIWEKGNSDGCDDYDSSSYDYYYDVDFEASSKLKYKRFTSV